MLQSGNKLFVVFTYDVSCNKRRQKVAKLLEEHGERVNYSVFECFVSPKVIEEIKNRLFEILKKKKDSVLIYYLCKRCIEKSDALGVKKIEHGLIKSL